MMLREATGGVRPPPSPHDDRHPHRQNKTKQNKHYTTQNNHAPDDAEGGDGVDRRDERPEDEGLQGRARVDADQPHLWGCWFYLGWLGLVRFVI